jgi:hypothetical protein
VAPNLSAIIMEVAFCQPSVIWSFEVFARFLEKWLTLDAQDR